MSATCEWTLTLNSKSEDMEGILDYLNKVDPGAFRCCEGNRLFTENSSARNIWGEFYLFPDDKLYIDLAYAVPEADWKVDSERIYEGGGGSGGDHAWLNVSYSQGILDFHALPCVPSMLPEKYWDEKRYRLYDSDTGEKMKILLNSRQGKSWIDTFGDCWNLGAMEDLVFCFRGEPKQFGSWEEAAAIIQHAGGEISDQYLQTADYLISNEEKPDGKNKKALGRKGVRLITEEEFLEGFAAPWMDGRAYTCVSDDGTIEYVILDDRLPGA